MDEAKFSDLVDCNFPYNDRTAALALIDQANAISSNAMFIVLHELSRPGADVSVTKETLLELIDAWSERMDHPLSNPVVSAARIMALGADYPIPSAEALMDEIAPFAGQYAALSIAYFACDDVDGLLEARESEIRTKWEAE